MRNHLAIYLTILSYFCQSSAEAPKCFLHKKDVEKKYYEFKCENDLVKIQCEMKEEDLCEVEIRDKLETFKFDLSNDQFKALSLFSGTEQVKAECSSKTNLCLSKSKVCDQYIDGFNNLMMIQAKQSESPDRCDIVGLSSAKKLASFSKNFLAMNEFTKKDCKEIAKTALKALDNKIELFRKNISLPFSDNRNFFNACFFSNEKGDHQKFVSEQAEYFGKIRGRILKRLETLLKVEELVCKSDVPAFYKDQKLSIDMVMCIVTEDSRLDIDEGKRDYSFSCPNQGVFNRQARQVSEVDLGKASLIAAQTTEPVEQKPLPAVLKAASETPIGLTPALAKVDNYVPNSGSTQQASSEGEIASGAVRNTISTADSYAAGQAFAPVYNKLSSMAAAARSLASGATVIGGSSNKTKLNTVGRTGTAEDVRIPQGAKITGPIKSLKKPDEIAAEDDTSFSNSATHGDPKKLSAGNLQKTGTVGGQSVTGGPRSAGLNAEADQSSGSAPAQLLTTGSKYETVLDVQRKLGTLKKPAQIKDFFVNEAGQYPDLREIIYKDADIRKLLLTKKIRIVGRNASATEVGPSMETADYVFSDNGTSFIPIKIKADK